MQKTTLEKLEVLSRELMRVVNEFNGILEEEGDLYAELNDEEEDCSIRAEMDILEDMRSDFRQIHYRKSDKKRDKQKAIEMGRTIYPFTIHKDHAKATLLYDVETDRQIIIAYQDDRLEGCHDTCPQCNKELIIDWETGKVLRQSDEDIYRDKLRSKYETKEGEEEKYLIEQQRYFEEKKKEINQWVDENAWLRKNNRIGFYTEMGIELEWEWVSGVFYPTTAYQNCYNVFYDENEIEYDMYRYNPKYKCDLKKIYN